MSTSACVDSDIQEILKDKLGDFPSRLSCEYLKAEHGITIFVQHEGVILTREPRGGRPFIRAALSKASGALIGPAIAVLDVNAPNALLSIVFRKNAEECAYTNGAGFIWYSEVSGMISRKDYVGALIKFAEKDECQFKSLWQKIKGL